jgi:BirA family transcriptional regulator, biotin operon repressor / biotin---[acetyl-CoA-carboxylase] ligase
LTSGPVMEHHESIPSTSDRLRVLAMEGVPAFSLVIADEQSEGRGRGGRSWHSPRNAGLWMSILLDAPAGGGPGVVPLLVGVLAARAVERAAGVPVGLKWPNDLVAGSGPVGPTLGKLGGVLAEAARTPDGPRIIVGVGVNLRRPSFLPTEAAGAAFLEEAAGRSIAAGDLAEALISEFRAHANPPPALLQGAVRKAWRERDVLEGRRVAPDLAPEGVAMGVGADGCLRVRDDSGSVHEVRAGSVRIVGEGPAAIYSAEG